MSNIITIGYVTEGPTDRRFLETIIKKTVDEIAYTCEGQLEVYDPIFLTVPKCENFVDTIISAAQIAFKNGIYILCVHVDADDISDVSVLNNKINPALKAINNKQNEICKIVAPIIPITMSEAWMLADKELFKNELGTELSDAKLNINKNPEFIANPKALIEDALRISQEGLPKRRFKLTIRELYQPIGQKITIEKLNNLNSFRKFKASIEKAFKELNYLH